MIEFQAASEAAHSSDRFPCRRSRSRLRRRRSLSVARVRLPAAAWPLRAGRRPTPGSPAACANGLSGAADAAPSPRSVEPGPMVPAPPGSVVVHSAVAGPALGRRCPTRSARPANIRVFVDLDPVHLGGTQDLPPGTLLGRLALEFGLVEAGDRVPHVRLVVDARRPRLWPRGWSTRPGPRRSTSWETWRVQPRSRRDGCEWVHKPRREPAVA
jgi:hypothetical protein